MELVFKGIRSIIDTPKPDNFLFPNTLSSKPSNLVQFIALWDRTNRFIHWISYHFKRSTWTLFADRFMHYYAKPLELACMQNYNLRHRQKPTPYSKFSLVQKFQWAFYPIVLDPRFTVTELERYSHAIESPASVSIFTEIFSYTYTMAVWKDLLLFFNSVMMVGPELMPMMYQFKEDVKPDAPYLQEITTYFTTNYRIYPTIDDYMTVRELLDQTSTVEGAVNLALERQLFRLPTRAPRANPWADIPGAVERVIKYRNDALRHPFMVGLEHSWVSDMIKFKTLKKRIDGPISGNMSLDDTWGILLWLNDQLIHLYAWLSTDVFIENSPTKTTANKVLNTLGKVSTQWRQYRQKKDYRAIYHEAGVFWNVPLPLDPYDIPFNPTTRAVYGSRIEEYFKTRYGRSTEFAESNTLETFMERMTKYPDYAEQPELMDSPVAVETAVNLCIERGLISDEKGESSVTDWYLATKTAKTMHFHYEGFKDWLRISFEGAYIYEQSGFNDRLEEINMFYNTHLQGDSLRLQNLWNQFSRFFDKCRELIVYIIEEGAFLKLSYSESLARRLTSHMYESLLEWHRDLLNDQYNYVYHQVMWFWSRQLHYPGGMYQINKKHLHMIDYPAPAPATPPTPPPISSLPLWYNSYSEATSLVDDSFEEPEPEEPAVEYRVDTIEDMLKRKEENQYKIFVPLDDPEPEPLAPDEEIDYLFQKLTTRKRLFRED